MAISYRPYEPQQEMLLPASLQKNLQDLASSGIDAVVALGREGKRCAEIDASKSPHTTAMAAKLQSNEGKAAYRRCTWIAEPPNGWIKSVLRFRQFSLRGLHRVQAEPTKQPRRAGNQSSTWARQISAALTPGRATGLRQLIPRPRQSPRIAAFTAEPKKSSCW